MRGGGEEDYIHNRPFYVLPSHRHESLELNGLMVQWNVHEGFPGPKACNIQRKDQILHMEKKKKATTDYKEIVYKNGYICLNGIS